MHLYSTVYLRRRIASPFSICWQCISVHHSREKRCKIGPPRDSKRNLYSGIVAALTLFLSFSSSLLCFYLPTVHPHTTAERSGLCPLLSRFDVIFSWQCFVVSTSAQLLRCFLISRDVLSHDRHNILWFFSLRSDALLEFLGIFVGDRWCYTNSGDSGGDGCTDFGSDFAMIVQ